MIKLLELFGGIGACSKALERCGIEYEIADYVEIDKYAVKSYNAMHNTNFEPQDITTWDKDFKVDLIMHGSPCQDFSIAGNNAGGDKGSGTRSSLMYETIRIVEKLKPRVVIWENVKNLLSKKHRHNFDTYLDYMHKLGYENYYKVLNAKNYGIPQNRERIFTISIRGAHNPFIFPDEMPLELRLKDMLESVVDEKFYLDGKYESITKINENYSVMNGGLIGKMNDISRRAYYENTIAPSIHTCGGGNTEPKVIVSCAMRGRYDENGNIKQQIEVSDRRISNSITTVQKDSLICDGKRIRKLTPLECWRLMGFDDTDFYKAEAVNSNTQLYKQAGNSIVVNVLCEILNNLMEVLEMNKTSETTLTVFETDKFFDIAALAEKEPDLFEELVNDYPVTSGTYQYKVG